MALKFNCAECDGDVIVKYIKPGEVAKCLKCGAENIVPANAEETNEEPDYNSRRKKKMKNSSVKHGREKVSGSERLSNDLIISPTKRFYILYLIAKVLKILALVVLIFSMIPALVKDFFIIGFMSILCGLVAAVVIYAFAEIILLFLHIEENTRVVREVAVHRYEEGNMISTDNSKTI